MCSVVSNMIFCFFFKQKTAYEMRISDWSSDVCSSDLHVRWRVVAAYLAGCAVALAVWSVWLFVPSKPLALLFLGITPFLARLVPEGRRPTPEKALHGAAKIGRASCRERVCQYV